MFIETVHRPLASHRAPFPNLNVVLSCRVATEINMLLIVLHAVTGNLEMMNMAFIGNVDLTQDQESLIITHIIPIFPSVKV